MQKSVEYVLWLSLVMLIATLFIYTCCYGYLKVYVQPKRERQTILQRIEDLENSMDRLEDSLK